MIQSSSEAWKLCLRKDCQLLKLLLCELAQSLALLVSGTCPAVEEQARPLMRNADRPLVAAAIHDAYQLLFSRGLASENPCRKVSEKRCLPFHRD